MSPSAMLMSVLPRLHCAHVYRRAALLNDCSRIAASLNCLRVRQHGTMSIKSTMKNVHSNFVMRPCLRANNMQQTRSSSSKVHTLPFKVDRYQGVHCDMGDIPEYVTAKEFDTVLEGNISI